MDFLQFKRQFQNQRIILSQDIVRGLKNPQALRNQLTRWQKKGLLVHLRKGMYILNAEDRKADIDQTIIANILYQPSYISLEYALNFYGLIPEAVSDVTSVSTRKTSTFNNELGVFRYQHIDPKAFRGFKKAGEGKNTFFMAEAEKAVVDFIYLNLGQFQGNTREVLEASYRFQNIESLNTKKLLELACFFGNEKLNRTIKDLANWVKESKA